MTTTATTQTIFANLFSKIEAEKAQELTRFVSDLNEKKDVWDILNGWYYNQLLPAGKKKLVWKFQELKTYLISRKRKEIEKELQKELKHLQTVESAPDLISITVSIEWKKSRMWGSNPRAEAKVEQADRYEYFDSGSIGGCGYDKESTAIAQAVNQSNSFLKAVYMVKEQAANINNRDLFGYGSGYGVLPRLEGGVGVSCYPSIFEKIGFKFKNTASGKTFDVYTITKL